LVEGGPGGFLWHRGGGGERERWPESKRGGARVKLTEVRQWQRRSCASQGEEWLLLLVAGVDGLTGARGRFGVLRPIDSLREEENKVGVRSVVAQAKGRGGGGGRGNQGPTWRVPQWGRSEGGVPHGGHEGRDPAPTGRRCPRITVFDRLGYKSSSSGHVVSKKSLFDRVQFDLGKRHQGMRNVPLPRKSIFHRLDFGDQNFRCASDAKSKGIQTSRGNSTNSSGNIDHHERRNGQVQISKSMGLKETMGQPKFCVHCLRACLFPAFHHFSY
jgi:hypothetical protein